MVQVVTYSTQKVLFRRILKGHLTCSKAFMTVFVTLLHYISLIHDIFHHDVLEQLSYS